MSSKISIPIQTDFDEVSRKLAQQGRPSVRPRTHPGSLLQGFVCVYLGADDERCAAGHLMNAEPDVLRRLSGVASDTNRGSGGPRALLVAGGHDIAFACALQHAHDIATSDFVDEVDAAAWRDGWAREMRALAGQYELDTTVFEAELLRAADARAEGTVTT